MVWIDLVIAQQGRRILARRENRQAREGGVLVGNLVKFVSGSAASNAFLVWMLTQCLEHTEPAI